MKKFNLVFLAVLTMVVAGFMGCATAVPLTNTDWLEYSNEEPVATIKTSRNSNVANFNVLQIGDFDTPTHEKNNTYWSPISVPANTELDIYGSYYLKVSGYTSTTTYSGRQTFNCPPLLEGKSYALKVEDVNLLRAIGKKEGGLSFMLYTETGKWVVQQKIPGGKQIFND
ncbi:hypothetical protein AGMMS50268_21350 [Spirochaetia bacterium]|nr:hypothetical protein AGMMS50268_21350 [Spirochaetia bacterium]